MYSYLSNGQIFIYTPDHELVEQFENGMPFPEIVSRLSSHDRISKTIAKRRVLTAVLKFQLTPALIKGAV